MEGLIDWVADHWEVLFSGIGVLAVGWILKVVFQRRQGGVSQSIRSGANSTNVQAGRDIRTKSRPKNEDLEEEK